MYVLADTAGAWIPDEKDSVQYAPSNQCSTYNSWVSLLQLRLRTARRFTGGVSDVIITNDESDQSIAFEDLTARPDQWTIYSCPGAY